MEPHLPTPQIGPEHSPVMPSKVGEQFRGVVETNSQSREQQDAQQESHETQSSGSQGDPVFTSPTVTPPPLPVIDPGQSKVTDTTIVDTPAEAADEDLIEKEWVEKAKRVVRETRTDPYAQEHAVSKLQADYLQKRYGKSIKVPGDS